MIRYIDLYGSEGEEGSEEEAGNGEEEGKEKEPETRTLTAAELESVAARAAGRGSRKATKELAKELGFDSVAAMKDFVGAQKKAQDEAKSDDEKAKEETATEAAGLAEDRALVRTERLDLAIQRAIVATGISEQKKLDRIAALIRDELDPDLEPDDWDEGVKVAIETLKEEWPELFTPAKTDHGSGDGGAGGSSTKDETEEEEKRWSKEYAAKGLGVPGTS